MALNLFLRRFPAVRRLSTSTPLSGGSVSSNKFRKSSPQHSRELILNMKELTGFTRKLVDESPVPTRFIHVGTRVVRIADVDTTVATAMDKTVFKFVGGRVVRLHDGPAF
eukprot:CAMPEP_0185255264 /NCGR_PEP_ID=MMETSP1359-20130426/4256_1 /TAXON_ID=552665 /ORGANISM="Bigelowiella longifila, Strain CCMP242" /LENGTH=109 /DNA_ID=CAMNT_0027839003 /DNA_START=66 /DNA_END=395 /DNA_ORIENTATION=+